MEARRRETMPGEGACIFNILGTLSIVVLLREDVRGGEFDFAPERIYRGNSIHVLSGTQGELVKIDRQGVPLGPVVTPFPSPIIDGLILNQVWIGIWLDREFRQARMAALPIEKMWESGSSREDLRTAINSLNGSDVAPSNSLWHRVMDSEPMKMGKSGDNAVFVTVSGIYMIDADANEVWRGLLPRWPSISTISTYDEIVGVVDFSGGVSIWSKAGGVSVLDPSNGLEIFSKVIDFGDSVADVIFSDDGGWFVMLHEGSVAIMDKIEDEPIIHRTGGPVLGAEFSNGFWRWTGWRHDGELSSSEVSISERENVGIGIIDGMVLANDGSWRDFNGYSESPVIE
ncbi:MAG: hypothetical protein CMA59_03715 [Euryarchaeota archaeon]|nr:hypothetical protein [Euryarchaeota archaeon]